MHKISPTTAAKPCKASPNHEQIDLTEDTDMTEATETHKATNGHSKAATATPAKDCMKPEQVAASTPAASTPPGAVAAKAAAASTPAGAISPMDGVTPAPPVASQTTAAKRGPQQLATTPVVTPLTVEEKQQLMEACNQVRSAPELWVHALPHTVILPCLHHFVAVFVS
jgi:hypothetical protein